ncbi:DUF3284 domain-containing protein [Fundicoccus culcitae]|uniref:DUF3284 domain-containing protein n=1 Tax=Fundicoccus culcitae TaxID=2969821 RepID=A0ABY5P9G8_9LACT|nr:DUF3284 domain-containing protein [Fundicoccus culcitae]UUX35407.1 DUF3284 domain-containing protein [Fundicoccus culcitae]
MKIIRTLSISSDAFYDYLVNQLLSEANAVPEMNYNRNHIKKGFKFHRNMQHTSIVSTTEVLDYQPGKQLVVKTTHHTDSIEFNYETRQSPKGLEVTFKQEMSAFDKKKGLRFFRGFSSAIYLSRMSNSLYAIQEQVLKEMERQK